MKQFAELFLNLDRTNKTNEKIDLLKNYFSPKVGAGLSCVCLVTTAKSR